MKKNTQIMINEYCVNPKYIVWYKWDADANTLDIATMNHRQGDFWTITGDEANKTYLFLRFGYYQRADKIEVTITNDPSLDPNVISTNIEDTMREIAKQVKRRGVK